MLIQSILAPLMEGQPKNIDKKQVPVMYTSQKCLTFKINSSSLSVLSNQGSEKEIKSCRTWLSDYSLNYPKDSI